MSIREEMVEIVEGNIAEVIKWGFDSAKHCIVMVSSGSHGRIERIYKTLDDFRDHGPEHMEQIDAIFDITFQFWAFD